MENMKAKMVSMMKEKEGVEGMKNHAMAGEIMNEPMYPYGLKIHLDDDSWKKIATASNVVPQVGEKMHLMINVEVTGVRSEKTQNEQPEIYVDLQITDMGFCEESKPKESAAVKIYGKKKG